MYIFERKPLWVIDEFQFKSSEDVELDFKTNKFDSHHY